MNRHPSHWNSAFFFFAYCAPQLYHGRALHHTAVCVCVRVCARACLHVSRAGFVFII